MSSPTDPTQAASASSDPAELRRGIEETRGELADTVEALADKADVKRQAKDKAQQLKAQAMAKAPEVRAQATAKAQQLTGTAQQKAQENPGAAVGVVLAVLGLLILRGRRRRRRKSAFSDLAGVHRDIEELRGELADMVNALMANRAEVKRQAKELKAQQLKAQATDKAQEFKAQATEKAQQLKKQAMEKAPGVRA